MVEAAIDQSMQQATEVTPSKITELPPKCVCVCVCACMHACMGNLH